MKMQEGRTRATRQSTCKSRHAWLKGIVASEEEMKDTQIWLNLL